MELWPFAFVVIVGVVNLALLARMFWRHVRFSLRAMLISLFILNCGLALIAGTNVFFLQVLGGTIVIVLAAVIFMHLVDSAVQDKLVSERKKIADEQAAPARRPPDV